MGKRGFGKAGLRTPISGISSSINLKPLQECGNPDLGIHIVRIITRESVSVDLATEAVIGAVPFMKDFNAPLLVTPGAFLYVDLSERLDDQVAGTTVQSAMTKFLNRIPRDRKFDIILGVDAGMYREGWLQDAYFIPRDADSIEGCRRAYKSYPRSDEVRYLYTTGRACSSRSVKAAGHTINMLICHDLASFSGRSKATRGYEQEMRAKQLNSEVQRGPDTGVLNLIHYLDGPMQGGVFIDGMTNLIQDGVAWGLSTFKTQLDPASSMDDLRKIQERTTRHAGPTLDLYLHER